MFYGDECPRLQLNEFLNYKYIPLVMETQKMCSLFGQDTPLVF